MVKRNECKRRRPTEDIDLREFLSVQKALYPEQIRSPTGNQADLFYNTRYGEPDINTDEVWGSTYSLPGTADATMATYGKFPLEYPYLEAKGHYADLSSFDNARFVLGFELGGQKSWGSAFFRQDETNLVECVVQGGCDWVKNGYCNRPPTDRLAIKGLPVDGKGKQGICRVSG